MTTEIVRSPIKLDRIEISDFLENFSGRVPKTSRKLVNIRGCNGSGKSTIPLQMLMKDRGAFIFTHEGKDRATCFPSLGYVALGKYRTKTGGMDGISTKAEKQELVRLLWDTPFRIVMEGVIDSTIYSTYSQFFSDLKEEKELKREITILNLLPPFETTIKRIKRRNGGKDFDEKSVHSKWKTVNKNAEKFREDGFRSLKVDNSEIAYKDILPWFENIIEEDVK